MLSALLAVLAILAIVAVAWALWRAVDRWEAAAMAELALEDLAPGGGAGATSRANGCDGKSGGWSLVGEQALARSIAARFADEVVEEVTVERPEGDAVVLHPTQAGGWQ